VFCAREELRLPELAPLRHADEAQECLLIGVDQKWPADDQSDAIDPRRTLRHSARRLVAGALLVEGSPEQLARDTRVKAV
jgi:hypothetical protein